MVGDYPKVDVQALLKHFKKWEQSEFKPMDLGVHKSLSIVTCMDSRLMPASMFGLELGDAEYIRNAGGRVTPDVIRSLVVADELLHTKTIFVIHHTDCGGQAAVKMHDVLEKRVKELGADLSELGELYGIKPPNDEGLLKSVKEDVEKLKASPFINPSIDLYGFVYDTLSGKLEEVVSYTPQS